MVETIKESTKTQIKLERERERESIDLFCYEQLGRNMVERWKWTKKKFMRKLRCKRNVEVDERLKISNDNDWENLELVEFLKIEKI